MVFPFSVSNERGQNKQINKQTMGRKLLTATKQGKGGRLKLSTSKKEICRWL